MATTNNSISNRQWTLQDVSELCASRMVAIDHGTLFADTERGARILGKTNTNNTNKKPHHPTFSGKQQQQLTIHQHSPSTASRAAANNNVAAPAPKSSLAIQKPKPGEDEPFFSAVRRGHPDLQLHCDCRSARVLYDTCHQIHVMIDEINAKHNKETSLLRSEVTQLRKTLVQWHRYFGGVNCATEADNRKPGSGPTLFGGPTSSPPRYHHDPDVDGKVNRVGAGVVGSSSAAATAKFRLRCRTPGDVLQELESLQQRVHDLESERDQLLAQRKRDTQHLCMLTRQVEQQQGGFLVSDVGRSVASASPPRASSAVDLTPRPLPARPSSHAARHPAAAAATSSSVRHSTNDSLL